MRLVVCVQVCGFLPDRVAAAERLRDAVMASGEGAYLENVEMVPSPVWCWAERFWRTALEMAADVEATHVALLPEDVIVPRFFGAAIDAIYRVIPQDVSLALHVVHPLVRLLCAAGERFATSTTLLGGGHILPTSDLAAFWKARQALTEQERRRLNEDTLVQEWLIQRRKRVWLPIPTLLRHDEDIASTGGRSGEYLRSTALGWESFAERDLCSVNWWRDGLRDPPRHLVFAGDCYPGVKTTSAIGFDGYKMRSAIVSSLTSAM